LNIAESKVTKDKQAEVEGKLKQPNFEGKVRMPILALVNWPISDLGFSTIDCDTSIVKNQEFELTNFYSENATQ
jgi:hypothetical protein